MNDGLRGMNIMTFQPERLAQLLQRYENPDNLLGEGGILKPFTKAPIERCLEAETKTHMANQAAQTLPKIDLLSQWA